MNYSAKITIGIPVYNGDNYITEALNSILSQDYKDFEVLISDNCSTDNTAELLKKYSSLDNRIRVVKTSSFVSLPENVNNVVNNCRTKWLQLFCHDDLLLEGSLSQLVSVLESLENENTTGVIGHSPAWLFDNKYVYAPSVSKNLDVYNPSYKIKSNLPISFFEGKKYLSEKFEGKAVPPLPAVTTAMVNIDALRMINGFDNRYVHFDSFGWQRLLLDFNYVYIPEALSLTRIHGNQVSVDARRSLRSIHEHRSFWKEYKKEAQNKLSFTFKKNMAISLPPISVASTSIAIELMKGHFINAFQIFFKLPISWMPFVSIFSIRNYIKEKKRIKPLLSKISLKSIYP